VTRQIQRHLRRSFSYARQRRSRFVQELQRFVRFPSVSAQPHHASDVKSCAQWLARHLTSSGLRHARVIVTPGHPIVYAEWCGAAGQPTLLVYGHYDVQPVDPLSAWRVPPFAARVVGPYLFGRGASDDKGQLFAHVKAIESVLRSRGSLPVNLRCLFEGEEEIGSRHLIPFLERHAGALRCDAAVMSDMHMLGPNRPAIAYSVRGQLGLELEVRGPARELHSGDFGGAILNPIQALGEILARLHTGSGRIAIPNFYDDVRTLSPDERMRMRRTGPSDGETLRESGARQLWGDREFNAYERVTIRPALTFNGVAGGYQGAGGKAVIPATATAKISFRLVPDQDPDRVEGLFRRYVGRIAPRGIGVRITRTLSARSAEIPRNHPALLAAGKACRLGFGNPAALIRLGGSIPVVEAFARVLRVPTIMMGFGLPDDRIHAPNEKFYLPNLFRGIDTSIALMHELARTLPSRAGGWSEGGQIPRLYEPAEIVA
jgi:acetylornithine deacetylase/succinyl-diaminopimelate desuccinylase-like protein